MSLNPESLSYTGWGIQYLVSVIEQFAQYRKFTFRMNVKFLNKSYGDSLQSWEDFLGPYHIESSVSNSKKIFFRGNRSNDNFNM